MNDHDSINTKHFFVILTQFLNNVETHPKFPIEVEIANKESTVDFIYAWLIYVLTSALASYCNHIQYIAYNLAKEKDHKVITAIIEHQLPEYEQYTSINPSELLLSRNQIIKTFVILNKKFQSGANKIDISVTKDTMKLKATLQSPDV